MPLQNAQCTCYEIFHPNKAFTFHLEGARLWLSKLIHLMADTQEFPSQYLKWTSGERFRGKWNFPSGINAESWPRLLASLIGRASNSTKGSIYATLLETEWHQELLDPSQNFSRNASQQRKFNSNHTSTTCRYKLETACSPDGQK